MKLQVLGIDLGKTVFHLVGLDSTGRVVIRKRCSRTQLLAFTANLQVQLIGMEACSGAHFLGQALREQGHEVRLMPAQYMKPYVQTNRETSSCQVCWRKIEMAMGLSHAFETRYRSRSLRGRPLYEDESERISIMTRSR